MTSDSVNTLRWASALLDSIDSFCMVPRGYSKPHPNLIGSPAIQTTVLRIYPHHFPVGEVQALSQDVLFSRPSRIHW